MALYSYQAFSRDGKKVSGQIDAPSLSQAKEQLTRQGLFPITIAPSTQATGAGGFFARFFGRKVTSKDKILFTQQLSTMLRAGVPLLQALELLADQFTGTMRTTLVAVKDEIKEGRSLNEALKKYPKIFDNIYVQLVRAGEATGNLEMILERLTQYLERQELVAARMRKALLMPLVQLGFSIAVVILLMVFVVPKILGVFGEDKELPLITAIVVGISNFIANYYLFITAAIIILVVAYRYWASSPAGRRKIDEIKLRLPLIKYFTRMNAIVQFSYTLGILIESGVNLAESLDIVVKIIDNQILADTLNQARDKIIKQGKIAQYLKQTNLFPPIAIYLIQTGEQTGKLDAMLLTVGKNYERDLEAISDSLSSSFSIILLIAMAAIVGIIVLAMILPIMEIMESAGV